jgi:hypothetical protein
MVNLHEFYDDQELEDGEVDEGFRAFPFDQTGTHDDEDEDEEHRRCRRGYMTISLGDDTGGGILESSDGYFRSTGRANTAVTSWRRSVRPWRMGDRRESADDKTQVLK